MQHTYNRRQQLLAAHPWLNEQQALQLLAYKYLKFNSDYPREQVQTLLDNFTTICCHSSETGMRDLLARAQEWY